MNDIRELIPVDWFDGLVLAPEHLEHSDIRVEALVAQVQQAALRPGVLASPWESGTPSQLVQLQSSRKETQGFSVDLVIARSAVLVAPSGQVIVLAGPGTGVGGTQVSSISIPDEAPEERLVVLASQHKKYRSRAYEGIPEGRRIDLRWPEIVLDVVGISQYEQHLHDRFFNRVAIGGLMFAADIQQVKADLRYIPPLTSLRGVSCFDEGGIARLHESFNELLAFVTRNIERLVGANDIRDATGQGRRRADYELLRMLLISNFGRFNNLENYSPQMFCCETMQPLAKWWLDFKDHAFPGGLTSELKQTTDSAKHVEQMSWTHLYAGTRELLDKSQALLDGMKEFIFKAT